MLEFDIPKLQSSIIKVIGVGGGGSNAVNYMHTEGIDGVDFIICNTDSKALEQSGIGNKIQLGPHLTQGLGAGANPEVGKQATEESLEEIQRILEVNTKMAFICAGMGGGTGTGGAPIIAKICQDLGILTVGIVTTPFGFEGPRRATQAESGIKQLEPYVDTLLVISNDKLRMQYGNLKMKDAFSKADNVLATAAKCITDIINSKGHIIVDFNDVCTVMENGGVAILGSASVEGEDRAQRAIEEALNSPLLNDNDIHGAKWILINVNTSEGDHECSMDEFETINNYVREQAGDATDVIVGIGYDNSLERKLGITLIATGFEHKDPFAKADNSAQQRQKEESEKQIFVLKDPNAPQVKNTQEADANMYAPKLVEGNDTHEQNGPMHFDLRTDDQDLNQPVFGQAKEQSQNTQFKPVITSFSGAQGYGQQTYARPAVNVQMPKPVEQKFNPFVSGVNANEEENLGMSLSSEPVVNNTPQPSNTNISSIDLDETDSEKQKRTAQDRIKKLRELQFNVNNNDPNSEFDTVPAYVRRNMDMFGGNEEEKEFSSVENFYSKYRVKKDENDKTNISSLNTFLDGKRPD
ncbi:MAG: cell division protein FtsZ [Pseudopedobacter saltans]|uniref:Cell division protein FtsZ n=1 Tax=Pseudopedobacter saltans TaxID=151895 RepID=A0A2W5F1A0_9SPHI|nr:MAG: cell division protein FtsZ [Pseudopedobacter saltans]